MIIQNDRLIKALLCQKVDRPPVWLMRQAGRYLPEYRATREKAGNFLNLCKTPELACEVTLQPITRFSFDAAILFSDILTIPDAMGLGLYFSEGEGPQFTTPLRTVDAIQQLAIPDPETELRYVMDAVRLIKRELQQKIPLIGFAGSPWTLASYMIEGGSSRDFVNSKALLYGQPEAMHLLLDKLSEAVALYLNAQIAAGADVVMLFDSWGGVLSTPAYYDFSLAAMRKVISQLQRERDGQKIPVIVFTKGGALWLEKIAQCGADGIGIDWSIDIAAARQRVSDKIALQGNLDPTILFTNPSTVKDAVREIIDAHPQAGHVFNLGHGILQHTPIKNVEALVAAVQGK